MCQIRDECARQCDGESIEMQHAFESDISHVKRDEFFRANGLLVEVTPNIPFVDPDVDKLLTEYKEWFATVLIEDVSLEDVLRSIEHFPDCLVIHSPYQISLTNTVDEDCIFGRFDIPPFISLQPQTQRSDQGEDDNQQCILVLVDLIVHYHHGEHNHQEDATVEDHECGMVLW